MEKILFLLSIFFTGLQTSDQTETLNHSSIIQESHYDSVVPGKVLPYYFIEPKDALSGIFIYMHGAGGGYEQGMSDELFKGNFKNLKTYLFEQGFLYVTPETTDFSLQGGIDLANLISKLKTNYGDLPVYVSGASAGGRTIFYLLQEAEKQNLELNGVIFVCPALSASLVSTFSAQDLPVWIEVGEKDTVISLMTAQELLNKFQTPRHLQIIPEGDHNAPVEQIDWAKAIDFIK